MPEQYRSVSREVADIAWDAADSANLTFTYLRELDRRIGGMQGVLDAQIEGVTVDVDLLDDLKGRREATQNSFHILCEMAGELASSSVNPFPNHQPKLDAPRHEERRTPVPAELFDTTTHLRTLQEIIDFGVWRRYPKQVAVRHAYTLKDDSLLPVAVKNFSDYPPLSEEELESQGLRVLKAGTPDAPIYRVDIDTLYHAVRRWIEVNPDDTGIRNLGKKGVSFFADYVNHARPSDDPPLHVAFPPEEQYY